MVAEHAEIWGIPGSSTGVMTFPVHDSVVGGHELFNLAQIAESRRSNLYRGKRKAGEKADRNYICRPGEQFDHPHVEVGPRSWRSLSIVLWNTTAPKGHKTARLAYERLRLETESPGVQLNLT